LIRNNPTLEILTIGGIVILWLCFYFCALANVELEGRVAGIIAADLARAFDECNAWSVLDVILVKKAGTEYWSKRDMVPECRKYVETMESYQENPSIRKTLKKLRNFRTYAIVSPDREEGVKYYILVGDVGNVYSVGVLIDYYSW
jgi:hypothetical protein